MNNHILIDFDLIKDTDVGIIKVIQQKYNDKKVFKQFLFNSDIICRSALQGRIELNPLDLIVIDDLKEESDDLYNQIISRESEDIIKYASNTNCTKLITSFAKTNLVYITVICKNIYEERYIRSLFNKNDKISIIIETDKSKIDISSYDVLYIKNIKDCLLFKDLKGKNIYIPNYGFNLEHTIKSKENGYIPLMDISILIGDVNRVYIVDLYTDTFLIS